MRKRKRKHGPIWEERDREPNPYWTMMDEWEREIIEAAYDGENNDEYEFDPFKFDDFVWRNPDS